VSELSSTNWNEVANSNNAASPNGWPEGMAPSGVNDSGRENMAALKRWFNRVHGLDNTGALVSSAGSGTTRTLSFTTAPASLFTGLIVCFKAGSDFDAASTLNVNSLGAKNIQKMTTSGLTNIVAGDIEQGQHVVLKYDGTADKWIMLSPTATAESGLADPMTTRGDIIYRNSSNATARLAVGAAETMLVSDGTDPSWADKRASVAEIRTGTSTTKLVTVANLWGAYADVALTDQATVTPDFSTGIHFTLTIGGNRTLANPTNVVVGRSGRIKITQDGTGGRTLTFGTNWVFVNSQDAVLSTGAGDIDVLYYDPLSATQIHAWLARDIG
jgi:hypothetical protein